MGGLLKQQEKKNMGQNIETTRIEVLPDDDGEASTDRAYDNNSPDPLSVVEEEEGNDEENSLDDEDAANIPNESYDDDEHACQGNERQEAARNADGLSFKKASEQTITEALEAYEALRERWMLDEVNQLGDWDRGLRLAKANFKKVDFVQISDVELETSYSELQFEIDTVFASINIHQRTIGMDQAKMLKIELTKMKEQCFATYELILAMFKQRTSCMSEEVVNGHLVRKTRLENLDPKQELLVQLYEAASLHEYRKHRGKLYKPVYTPKIIHKNSKGEVIKIEGGYKTHYYKEETDVVEFVKRSCDRQLMEKHWKFVTASRRSTKAIISDLTDTLLLLNDHQLPEVVRDRHKFSFKNGIYMTRCMTTDEKTGKPKVVSRFFPYTDESIKTVNTKYVSAKYFDTDFQWYPDEEDYINIPTPVIDTILKYQYGHSPDYEEIYRSAFMDMGRMLFSRGDLDNWQYMVHWLGIAGTGKSIITEHTVKNFYEPANRIEIDNSIEKQFGLGMAVKDKIKDNQIFITTSGELDAKCQLELPMALKMCDGSEIMAAIKNGEQIIFTYPSHWMAAENEYPASWKDTAGQVQRRMKMYEFCRRVKRKDKITNLNDRVQQELPHIIQKATKAYLYFTNKYGKYGSNSDWLSFCPKYFLQTQDNLVNNANYLRSYILESNRVLIHSSLFVSEEDLYQDYRELCKLRGWRSDIRNKTIVYETIIQELNDTNDLSLEYRKCSHLVYEGKMQHNNQYYFFGIGLSSHISEEEREVIESKIQQREEIRIDEEAEYEEEIVGEMLGQLQNDEDNEKGKEENV
jgi:hypothetical protein